MKGGQQGREGQGRGRVRGRSTLARQHRCACQQDAVEQRRIERVVKTMVAQANDEAEAWPVQQG